MTQTPFKLWLTRLVIGIIVILPIGCNLINPDESIPSYLYIPKITLATTGDQGAASNQILDGWVFINDALLGVYELPATIPVLTTGYTKVEIRAGVRKNGQSNVRVYYPFYQGYIKYTTLLPKVVDSLGPITISYKPNVKFELIESFDEPSTKFELYKRGVLDTFYRVTGKPYAWGGSGGSALIEIKNDTTIVEVTTLNEYLLPSSGNEVYLEMDYRTNYQFTTGFYVTEGVSRDVQQVPIISLYPTDTTWRKLYLSLKEDIASQESNSKFKIFFGSAKTSTGYIPQIYIDNVKLVRFE
jgi:hypothetical protein